MKNDLYYKVELKANDARYDLSEDLSSLTIKETSGMADELTLNLKDPYKVLSHALQEGMLLEVDLGTVSEHSMIFRGKIYKIDCQFPKDAVPTMRVLAYDRSMEMGLRKRSRVWRDMTLYQVVEAIAKRYFDIHAVKIKVAGNPIFKGNGLRQHEKTDLQFLHQLAKKYACELFVTPGLDKDQLIFKSQQKIMSAKPKVTLSHGRCGAANQLLSFDASSAVNKIQVPRKFAGIDAETGELITQKVTEVKKPKGTIEDKFKDENLIAFSKAEPDRAARLDKLLKQSSVVQNELHKKLGDGERQAIATFTTNKEIKELEANQFSTSIHGMRGNGAVAGNQYIHAQAVIEIADVGGRFSGTWYLSEVRHVLNDQGYKTEFQCQR